MDHSVANRQPCPVCGNCYAAGGGLNRHITRKHPTYRQAHPLVSSASQPNAAAAAFSIDDCANTRSRPITSSQRSPDRQVTHTPLECTAPFSVPVPAARTPSNCNDNEPCSSPSNATFELPSANTVVIADSSIDSNNTENSFKHLFACVICGKGWSTKQGLAVHIGKAHADEANHNLAQKHCRAAATSEKREKSDRTRNDAAMKTFDPETEFVKSQNATWTTKLQQFAGECFCADRFNSLLEDYSKFLFEANSKLPGPKHPAVAYYQRRKQKSCSNTDRNARNSSNPARANTKVRQNRRDKYAYDLAQYHYTSQRRKVCRMIMNAKKSRQCSLPIATLNEHFRALFENENAATLDNYGEQNDFLPDHIVTLADVREACKGISHDTSSGIDRVLMRTISKLDCAEAIQTIANVMLSNNYVPLLLRRGRTVLIDKGEDDETSLGNWRPITIYSIVRRIIERALEKVLRASVELSCHQRGFVSSPGTHVNASIINACLKHAKATLGECVVVFLDISKAFDNISHAHLENVLLALNIPDNVRKLILKLLCCNTVRIESNRKHTDSIEIRRGVAQGSPLSPLLFNIAIDFILREISEPSFAEQYGLSIFPDLPSVSVLAFADDIALVAHSEAAAVRMVDLAVSLFGQIGLQVNPRKCSAIKISEGKLMPDVIRLLDRSEISCIGINDVVRYLGITFRDEIIFDKNIIKDFTENLCLLRKSHLLKPDQKLNIINQYVFPQLIYPLQAAPLAQIDKGFLTDLDVIIRRNIKSICGLPAATVTEMIYAPRKHRGLGAVCCEWEAVLQHFSLASRLLKVNDELFQRTRGLSSEMEHCKSILHVDGNTSIIMRSNLRNKCFDSWCKRGWQGIGIALCKEYTPANSWIVNKSRLSSSEWTDALKLCANYAPLRGVPGVVGAVDAAKIENRLCRQGCREKETPAHVLGFCKHNSSLITERHHRVKRSVRALLQAKGFVCFEEVFAVDTESRARFNDIVAIDVTNSKGYVIDPTVRFERNRDPDKDATQADDVDAEKKKIYEPCLPFLEASYQSTYGPLKWEVIGLFFGARGMVPTMVVNFWKRFDLPFSALQEISQDILVNSIHIIRNHIYGATKDKITG